MALSFAYLAFRRTSFHRAALVVGAVGLVANGLSIVGRGIAAGRTPWGNMYEYSALLTFLIVLAYLVIVEWRYHVTTLGGFIYGFAIWTFGVICGAIWAQQTWGRYWGWDPKETWSFITWTIFAGYLHARATAGWKGAKAASIALVGFVSLLITYYAVNLWIAGLHTYAK